ncbi:hypothetical protein Tco_0475168 [Tanacetum coccineum]
MRSSGEIEANAANLLSMIDWSVVTYAQFWGVKFGEDYRRKALVCDSIPFMIEYSGSAAGEKEHVDPWKYRGLCESFAHVIDHVKDNDHGKSPLDVSKLLDAYTNTVPVFAIVEEEDSKGCPLMGAAFACGLKLFSKVEDAHTVYSDFLKGSKTRKLEVYSQVGFGSTLFAKFSEPRMADKKKKKSISTPKLATKPLWGKPEAGWKRPKPATGSPSNPTAEGGQTSSPLPVTAIAMDDPLP